MQSSVPVPSAGSPVTPHPSRSRQLHGRAHGLVAVLVLVALLAVSCGSEDELTVPPGPVATTGPVGVPTPAATAQPEPAAPTSTAEAEPTPAPTVAEPRPTSPPATTDATATPSPTPATTPAPDADPTATASPTPVATSQETPITAGVGEHFVISFAVDPTDFRWQLDELPEGSLLELVDERFVAPVGDTDTATGWQHFTFRGDADGRATVNFWLTHTAGLPLDQAQFDVVIGGGDPVCSQVFRVDVGERFEIVLDSNSTTGYQWELSEAPAAGVVALISDEYLAPASGALGSGGKQRFTFEGRADGETDLDFHYVRPFDDPPAPANVANFNAIVGTGIPGCSAVFTPGVGETFEIVLPANPSTGYRWEVEDVPDPSVITLIGDEFIPPATTTVGTTGWQVLRFRGVAVGRTPLKLWYVRPVDSPRVPTDRSGYMVIVE